MKKDKYIAMFMTTLMIAIPIGAVMILMVYAFGLMTIPDGKTTYDFIKDHGSLIAGLIGIVGVGILVFFQIKTHKEIIENSKNIVLLEKFESDKKQFFYDVKAFHACLSQVRRKKFSIDFNDIDLYTKTIDDFEKLSNILFGIDIFLKSHNIPKGYFDFIECFCSFYANIIYLDAYIIKYEPDVNKENLNAMNDLLFPEVKKSLSMLIKEYSVINGNRVISKPILDAFNEFLNIEQLDQLEERHFKNILKYLSYFSTDFIDKKIR